MQATQSRTASELFGRSIEFSTPGRVDGGIGEGAGPTHDAKNKNLLEALSHCSELLAMPWLLHEEHREHAAELQLLSNRSWAMIARLINHVHLTEMAASVERAVLPGWGSLAERC